MIVVKPLILIIEIDPSYARFLKNTLLDNDFEVIVSKSGTHALKTLEDSRADLIIAEYYQDDIRGDDLYKQVRVMYPDIPIIFISHDAQERAISKMLSYPRTDYMVKPVVMTELLARIQVELKQDAGKKGNMMKAKDLKLDMETFTAKRGKETIELSPTEFSLLKYLMANKGTVLTREMILSKVWGYDTEVSSRVVDVYIGYLRDKIDSGYKDKLIETVRGFGYRIKN